ncbi:pilus assembly protein [Chelatococcus sp. SYSU_G07232]|uniref:Pilus assembly protein n=1 Tax=Chelatococcus albus TaxID=3047466 RepID=A0ABT7AE34_9HYPH|nr:TadE/TadG family type IV pilus assembly protein [Chelatococcus sp. SYSU_G07232]MDJ1157652.1 pilus assembly protein [Chelatococcus sp. SYSU_G07232]
MTMHGSFHVIARRTAARASDLPANVAGASAIEFALVFPLLVAMFFTLVELADGWGAKRKLYPLTRTLADLVARTNTVNQSDLKNVFNAASAVMQPYESKDIRMRITSIDIDAAGKATVLWSCGFGLDRLPKGAGVTLPDGIAVPGRTPSIIRADTEFHYTPTIGYMITGTIVMRDEIYMTPRLVPRVGLADSCPPPPT